MSDQVETPYPWNDKPYLPSDALGDDGRLPPLDGLRDQGVGEGEARSPEGCTCDVRPRFGGEVKLIHGREHGRDAGLVGNDVDNTGLDLDGVPSDVAVVDGGGAGVALESTAVAGAGGIDNFDHVPMIPRTARRSVGTGASLSDSPIGQVPEIAVRFEIGQRPDRSPFHAQNLSDLPIGQDRTGAHGHLSEVPAAYKRERGDRSADWRASIHSRHALEVALEVAGTDLEIARATNVVLTEALYLAVEGRTDTTRITAPLDLTETETP